jgi:hypothetical protein
MSGTALAWGPDVPGLTTRTKRASRQPLALHAVIGVCAQFVRFDPEDRMKRAPDVNSASTFWLGCTGKRVMFSLIGSG